MYKQNRILGIIPARGSNDEVDHLNIKQLGGRPMLTYSIQSALKALSLDTLIVSTEDERTAEIAKRSGAHVPFFRPASLSDENATLRDVVSHALSMLDGQFDIAVTLLPNSPFRSPQDTDDAVALLVDGGYDSVSSVVELRDFFWSEQNGSYQPLTHAKASRRKDCRPIYRMAGGIEACWVSNYGKPDSLAPNIGFYKMGEHNAMTVNTIYDLLVAERLIKLPESLIRELMSAG